jgi:translation initiation factor 1 (eIF-1/SUI1)
MTSPMDQRKKLLKDMKKSFGVGGTVVDGVLEIQGAYAERAVQVLHKQGYSKARKIGK